MDHGFRDHRDSTGRIEIRLILFDGFSPRLARHKMASEEIAGVIERDECAKSIAETVPPLRRQRCLFFFSHHPACSMGRVPCRIRCVV